MIRTQIKKVSGKVVIDAAGANVHLYSKNGISVELMEETVAISSDRSGTYDEVAIGRLVQVKVTPTQFTTAALAAIFTHGAVPKGGSILSATDKTLDVYTTDGFRRRIPNAFVFAEPAMTCKTGSTVLGEVTWYGIIPLAGDPSLIASFYNKTEVPWDESSWDPDNELTPGWNFSWPLEEESAWDGIDTQGGVTITPKSTLDEDRSDRDGLKNVTIRDYSVEVKASVMNISEDLVLAATGWNGGKLGAKKGGLGRTIKLNSTTEDAFIRCYGAVLQQPFQFRIGPGNTVVGDLNWLTRPRFTAGALGPHLLVATEDPDA